MADLDYQTIRNYAWVARRFDVSRRRETLSFQHHAEVASLPPEVQDRWLDRAVQNNWSRNQLRQYVRASRRPIEPEDREVEPAPRIVVPQARVERWQLAAQRSSTSLESWIVSNLDCVATRVLGAEDAPAVAGRAGAPAATLTLSSAGDAAAKSASVNS